MENIISDFIHLPTVSVLQETMYCEGYDANRENTIPIISGAEVIEPRL
jgi:hypothetical protein